MREIIFRGKRTDNGEWVEGFYTLYANNRGLHPCILTGTEQGCVIPAFVIPETVGQFTGLTDINGQRIFEGDIVKTHYANSIKADFVEQVVFYSGGFCAMYKLQDGGMYSKLADGCLPCGNVPYMDRAEVIGNIYDNPELLEDCK